MCAWQIERLKTVVSAGITLDRAWALIKQAEWKMKEQWANGEKLKGGAARAALKSGSRSRNFNFAGDKKRSASSGAKIVYIHGKKPAAAAAGA